MSKKSVRGEPAGVGIEFLTDVARMCTLCKSVPLV